MSQAGTLCSAALQGVSFETRPVGWILISLAISCKLALDFVATSRGDAGPLLILFFCCLILQKGNQQKNPSSFLLPWSIQSWQAPKAYESTFAKRLRKNLLCVKLKTSAAGTSDGGWTSSYLNALVAVNHAGGLSCHKSWEHVWTYQCRRVAVVLEGYRWDAHSHAGEVVIHKWMRGHRLDSDIPPRNLCPSTNNYSASHPIARKCGVFQPIHFKGLFSAIVAQSHR